MSAIDRILYVYGNNMKLTALNTSLVKFEMRD